MGLLLFDVFLLFVFQVILVFVSDSASPDGLALSEITAENV